VICNSAARSVSTIACFPPGNHAKPMPLCAQGLGWLGIGGGHATKLGLVSSSRRRAPPAGERTARVSVPGSRRSFAEFCLEGADKRLAALRTRHQAQSGKFIPQDAVRRTPPAGSGPGCLCRAPVVCVWGGAFGTWVSSGW
jgi:hypothetical protein